MEFKYMDKSIHALRVLPGAVKTPLSKDFADISNAK